MFSRSFLVVVCRHNKFQTPVKHLVQYPRLAVTHLPVQLTSTLVPGRFIHLTAKRFDGEENDGKAKAKVKARKVKMRKEAEKKSLVDEVMSAAVEAAKSLPGDWTRTADELMNRLVMHDGRESVQPSETTEEKTGPLLAKMQVGRGFERTKSRPQRQRLDDPIASDLGDAEPRSERTRVIRTRGHEVFSKVYGQPALGIFDPKTFKGASVEQEKDLWQEKDLEDIRKARGSLPRNSFEEMIQWTKEGKMWTYPIDNEADMHEERKYQFHEHIFLERHLDQFPSQGPLRRFMDLVVLGLSKNPWVSVPEKEEHIQWFADYFREKQNLLETALGDQAKLKDAEP